MLTVYKIKAFFAVLSAQNIFSQYLVMGSKHPKRFKNFTMQLTLNFTGSRLAKISLYKYTICNKSTGNKISIKIFICKTHSQICTNVLHVNEQEIKLD